MLGPRDTTRRAIVDSVPSPEFYRGVGMRHRGEQMPCEKDITVVRTAKMSALQGARKGQKK